MAVRMLAKAATASASTPFLARSFQTSSRRLTDAVALPARKPVGAFRGGLFGFLLGTSLAGSGVYYYVVQEYRASNELLTEDIYALSNAIQRYTDRLASIEEKMEVLERKKK